MVVAGKHDGVQHDEAEHEAVEPRVGDELVDALHPPLEAVAPAQERPARFLRDQAQPLLESRSAPRSTPTLLSSRLLRRADLLLLLDLLLGLRRVEGVEDDGEEEVDDEEGAEQDERDEVDDDPRRHPLLQHIHVVHPAFERDALEDGDEGPQDVVKAVHPVGVGRAPHAVLPGVAARTGACCLCRVTAQACVGHRVGGAGVERQSRRQQASAAAAEVQLELGPMGQHPAPRQLQRQRQPSGGSQGRLARTATARLARLQQVVVRPAAVVDREGDVDDAHGRARAVAEPVEIEPVQPRLHAEVDEQLRHAAVTHAQRSGCEG